MTAQMELQPVTTEGWRSGFGALFRRESRRWWGTRRWVVQAVMWAALLNGFLAFGLFVMPQMLALRGEPVGDTLEALPANFFAMGALGCGIGVIILAQDLVFGERQSGTAEWLLSKPVSRTAFILTKFLANVPGMLLTMVIAPTACAAALYRAADLPFTVMQMVAPAALLLLHLMFYLALTLLGGVMARSREMVLAISLGSLLGGALLVNILGPVGIVTPWPLPNVMGALALGEALPGVLLIPVIATAALTAICLAAAVILFERQEI